MDVVWLSANKFGYELLKKAVKIKGIKVNAVITSSENSKTVMYDGAKKDLWHTFGIDVFEVEKINEEKEILEKLKPDLVVMCGWRQIIDKDILDIPKKGVVGFHPTLLPKGRGPAPIINSILCGFKESGVTMFYVGEGLDDGDIIGQEKFRVSEEDYAEDVYDKVILGGKKLIKKYLPLLDRNTAPRIHQDGSKTTFFEKRMVKDNKIDLEKENLNEIYRKIRALSKPYMGAYIEKDGKKLIIWNAQLKDIK